MPTKSARTNNPGIGGTTGRPSRDLPKYATRERLHHMRHQVLRMVSAESRPLARRAFTRRREFLAGRHIPHADSNRDAVRTPGPFRRPILPIQDHGLEHVTHSALSSRCDGVIPAHDLRRHIGLADMVQDCVVQQPRHRMSRAWVGTPNRGLPMPSIIWV